MLTWRNPEIRPPSGAPILSRGSDKWRLPPPKGGAGIDGMRTKKGLLVLPIPETPATCPSTARLDTTGLPLGKQALESAQSIRFSRKRLSEIEKLPTNAVGHPPGHPKTAPPIHRLAGADPAEKVTSCKTQIPYRAPPHNTPCAWPLCNAYAHQSPYPQILGAKAHAAGLYGEL
jgi:hypothetical protein